MSQSPHADELTAAERADNEASAQELVPGNYYCFDPPVTATGVPVGGPDVCEAQELEFSRGWYISFVDGKHVFQGKPVNDPRAIDDQLRRCYFHVLFTGGSKATLDDDQDSD